MRKEFPGDPKRSSDIVPYTAPAIESEGSLYYVIAFASSMGTLFTKSKMMGWTALISSLLCAFTDKASATGGGGSTSRLSTVILAFTSLLMAYMPEIIALVRLFS